MKKLSSLLATSLVLAMSSLAVAATPDTAAPASTTAAQAATTAAQAATDAAKAAATAAKAANDAAQAAAAAQAATDAAKAANDAAKAAKDAAKAATAAAKAAATTTEASAADTSEQWLKEINAAIHGVWVDADGHRAVEFQLYSINGERITKASRFEGDKDNGKATITIIDKDRTYQRNIVWSTQDGQKTLVLESKMGDITLYPQTEPVEHKDSVGGVTLDTPLLDIKSVYGYPNKKLKPEETYKLCGIKDNAWYWNTGMLITYDSRTYTVDRIVIFKDGSCALDKTGLGCKDSLEKFAGFWGWDEVPAVGSRKDIGNKEFISFVKYPEFISLELENCVAAE